MRTVDYFIRLARFNLSANPTMESSARLCLEDAIHCANNGQYDFALDRAIKSLAYSVGVFGKDYKDAILFKSKREV